MARRHSRTTGAREWSAEAEDLMEALMRAAERSVNDGLRLIERHEKRELSRRSHPLGTPTNAPPGTPPSLVTGHMRASWRAREARRTRRWKVEGSAGNTSVQARIQELGGRAGRNHAATLPPRPYLGPAIAAARDEIHAGFKRRFEVVILKTSV